MNAGIGNVKGKGGGHPTITLSASQFSDATNLTFTQAQAEILQNNEVVNVVLPDNSTRTIYKATNDYIGAIVFSQSTQDLSSEIGGQMANVLVLCNPSTYEGMVIQAELNGTIANPTLSGNETELTSIGIGSTAYKIPQGGGKQLYQHNLTYYSANSDVLTINIKIVNDSPTLIETQEQLATYLQQNNFVRDQSSLPYNRFLSCTGCCTESNQTKVCFITGIFYNGIAPAIDYFECGTYHEQIGSIASTQWRASQASYYIKDIVIAL